MRSRSPWATQQAIVGLVLIAMAAALLLVSLESDWGTAIASAAAMPSSTEGPTDGPSGGSMGGSAAGSTSVQNVMAASASTTAAAPPVPATAGPATSIRSSAAVSSGAIPLQLQVPDIALSAAITPYTPAEVAAAGGAVKPPTLFSVSWWTGGGDPGTTARNTVYLYGHTWKEPAVFNRIKELRTGARVVVTTTAGRLVYVVDGSFTVSKPDLVTNQRVTEAVPGRLLLIGCYRATGHEAHTTANIVVSAHLAS